MFLPALRICFLGTGLVVTSVIISSCHLNGKNRIGRFGNFRVWHAWYISHCHYYSGMYHPNSLGCTSASWAWLASSLAVYFFLNTTNRTSLLPEFTAIIDNAIHPSFVIHLGRDSFSQDRSLWQRKQSTFWLAVRRAELVDTEEKQSCGESQWPWLSWEPQLPPQCSLLTDPANVLLAIYLQGWELLTVTEQN